jgi:hypothetical protein
MTFMRLAPIFRSLITLLIVLAQIVATPLHAVSRDINSLLDDAEKGNPKAQFDAGVVYETGLQGDQEFSKAAEWYEKAAAQGYGPAQVSLGYLYQTGKGVPPDPAKAADYYRKAAAAGDVSGQFHLAVSYINGIGVPRDGRQAAEWMFKAAEAGDQQAQLMFATMLQTGTGIKRNEFAARRWYDKAARGQDENLSKKAASLREKIDQRVLFSGSFRAEDLAAVAAIGFGLAVLMYALVPEHARTGPSPDYPWDDYQPPDIFWPTGGAQTPMRRPGFISFKPRPHNYMGDFTVQDARRTNPR